MSTADRISEICRRNREAALAEAPEGVLGDLYRRAMTEYGATCFWNSVPPPTPDGMLKVAEILREYGDMKAWHLAEDIREQLGNAARQFTA